MKKYIILILLVELLPLVLFCQDTTVLNIIASMKSLSSVVSSIAKDNVKVSYQSELSPHDITLSTIDIRNLAKVDCYIASGLFDFEIQSVNFIKKNNPKAIIILITDIAKPYNADPHLFISLANIKVLVIQINDKLQNYRLQNYIDKDKFEGYVRNIDDLINKYNASFLPYKGKSIVIYHNALYYLLLPFGINQVAITKDEDIKPSLKVISEKIDFIKNNNIKYIFTEDDFDKVLTNDIANKTNISVIDINLFEYDLVSNLDSILEKVLMSIK